MGTRGQSMDLVMSDTQELISTKELLQENEKELKNPRNPHLALL